MKKPKAVRCWAVTKNGRCVWFSFSKSYADEEAEGWRMNGQESEVIRGTFTFDPKPRAKPRKPKNPGGYVGECGDDCNAWAKPRAKKARKK